MLLSWISNSPGTGNWINEWKNIIVFLKFLVFVQSLAIAMSAGPCFCTGTKVCILYMPCTSLPCSKMCTVMNVLRRCGSMNVTTCFWLWTIHVFLDQWCTFVHQLTVDHGFFQTLCQTVLVRRMLQVFQLMVYLRHHASHCHCDHHICALRHQFFSFAIAQQAHRRQTQQTIGASY